MASAEIKRNELLRTFITNPVSARVPRPVIDGDKVYGRVLTCQNTDFIPDVFRTLSANMYSALPVMKGADYIGWVSMLDLVRYVASLFAGRTEEEWSTWWEAETMRGATVQDCLDEQSNVTKQKLPAPICYDDNTSFYAFESLVRNPDHRRCIVLNPTTHIPNNITSQSMMISWLRQLRHLWGNELRKLKVRDIPSSKFGVSKIKEHETALTGFNLLSRKGCAGLAIVDDDGILVGNLSAKDLRGVGADATRFYRLFLSCKEYKAAVRRDNPRQAPDTHYSKKLIPRKGLYVTPSETFEDVIDKLNDGNLHRLFVCSDASDSNDAPVPFRVISQFDVLKKVFNIMIQ